MTSKQGHLDLFDDIPLSLADDPDLDLGCLLTIAPVGRHEPGPVEPVELDDVEPVEPVELDDVDPAPAPDPGEVRAMFAGLGWPTTGPVDPMRSREYRRNVRDYVRNGPTNHQTGE